MEKHISYSELRVYSTIRECKQYMKEYCELNKEYAIEIDLLQFKVSINGPISDISVQWTSGDNIDRLRGHRPSAVYIDGKVEDARKIAFMFAGRGVFVKETLNTVVPIKYML